MEKLSEQKEAGNLLQLYGNDFPRILDLLERQLNTLSMRAQLLMTLAGIVVTVTGFSGRLIAGTHVLAQWAIIVGLFFVLSSVVWVLTQVMALRWITRELNQDAHEAIVTVLTTRNRKTRAFLIGTWILCFGLFIYSIAVSIMLLNPDPLYVPVR